MLKIWNIIWRNIKLIIISEKNSKIEGLDYMLKNKCIREL